MKGLPPYEFIKNYWTQKPETFKLKPTHLNRKPYNLNSSSEAIKLDIYKFHQAADYHRHYTIKQLLPKHEIVVN